jgi:hypothetical protein
MPFVAALAPPTAIGNELVSLVPISFVLPYLQP